MLPSAPVTKTSDGGALPSGNRGVNRVRNGVVRGTTTEPRRGGLRAWGVPRTRVILTYSHHGEPVSVRLIAVIDRGDEIRDPKTDRERPLPVSIPHSTV